MRLVAWIIKQEQLHIILILNKEEKLWVQFMPFLRMDLKK